MMCFGYEEIKLGDVLVSTQMFHDIFLFTVTEVGEDYCVLNSKFKISIDNSRYLGLKCTYVEDNSYLIPFPIESLFKPNKADLNHYSKLELLQSFNSKLFDMVHCLEPLKDLKEAISFVSKNNLVKLDTTSIESHLDELDEVVDNLIDFLRTKIRKGLE